MSFCFQDSDKKEAIFQGMSVVMKLLCLYRKLMQIRSLNLFLARLAARRDLNK